MSDPSIEKLFDGATETHNQLWRDITPGEAVITRLAIVRAEQIREEDTDPGDAYLQGLAAGLAIRRRAEGATATSGASVKKVRAGKAGSLKLIISDGPDAAASAM